jgi:3',5'-cyclic AMP phosphodiesterase CpdA
MKHAECLAASGFFNSLLNSLVPKPEFVPVTGDLVDLGLDEEYELFRELMSPLRSPYFVIPGNHDNRDAFGRAFPDAAYLPRGGEHFQYTLEDHALRFVGLDTLVTGRPYGEMGYARLAWLEEQLSKASDRLTILFMRHPPFLTGIQHMDAQNCRDGSALSALIKRYAHVRAILCGHVHRFIATNWHGIEAVVCPGSSHSVALDLTPTGPSAFTLGPPACLLHAWTSEDRLVSHISFIGSMEGPFPFFDQAV